MTTKTTDGVPSHVDDLEARINARRAEIIARLGALKEVTGIEAATARSQLKAKLSELGHIIKEGVVDGWASIGEIAKRKLDHWLAEAGKAQI